MPGVEAPRPPSVPYADSVPTSHPQGWAVRRSLSCVASPIFGWWVVLRSLSSHFDLNSLGPNGLKTAAASELAQLPDLCLTHIEIYSI